MADDTVLFPGAWQNLPKEVRMMLTARAIEKQMAIQGGSTGLIEWLYRGQQRPELLAIMPALVHKAGVVRYNAAAKELYPLVLEDTKRYLAERAKRKSQPTED